MQWHVQLFSAGCALVAVGTVVLAPLVVRAVGARWHAEASALAQYRLADLFVFVEPSTLLRWSAALTAVVSGAALAITGSVGWTLIAALASFVTPRWLIVRGRARRQRRLLSQLPDGLAALAGTLRAGVSLPQAIALSASEMPHPLGQEFQLLNRLLRVGTPLHDVVSTFEQRVPLPEVGLFATAVRVARDSGGNLAESLERLADTLRRRLALEQKIAALTSQGKIQGVVVGLLPLVLLVVLASMDPAAMRPLFTTGIGYAVLGLVAALEFAGFLLIRAIVRIDV